MRRVIFHDGGPRVAAAAGRLAEDYDIRPLSGQPIDALVLVGSGSKAQPNSSARLIGLVEAGDKGPGATWSPSFRWTPRRPCCAGPSATRSPISRPVRTSSGSSETWRS